MKKLKLITTILVTSCLILSISTITFASASSFFKKTGITNISFTISKNEINIGEKIQSKLTFKSTKKPKIIYTSSNIKIASVTSTGLITGILQGNCIINVKIDTQTAKLNLIVQSDKNFQIKLLKSTIYMGDTTTLNFINAPDDFNKSKLKYSSNTPETAAISKNGLITAKNPGYTNITVNYKGKAYTNELHVLDKVTSITLKNNYKNLFIMLCEKTNIINSLNIKTKSGQDYDGSLIVTSPDKTIFNINDNNITANKTANTYIKIQCDSFSFKIPIIIYDENTDTDKDGLTDYQEIHKYFTNLELADSDKDGIPDGDWNERREYTYTVESITKIHKLYNFNTLNNNYQDSKIIKTENDWITIDVIKYPNATNQSAIESNFENKNWIKDNANNINLQQYLKPGITSDYDEQMKKDLINQLSNHEININKISDRELVKAVHDYIEPMIKYQGFEPTEFLLNVKDNNAYFPDEYKSLVDKAKLEYTNKFYNGETFSDDEFINHIIKGKGMYNNKIVQTCSSYASLYNTIFRALGIPSRIILLETFYDFGNKNEIDLSNNLKNETLKNEIQESYLPESVADHFVNEIYIGHHWMPFDGTNNNNSLNNLDRFIITDTENDFMDFKMYQLINNLNGSFDGAWYHSTYMSDMYGKNIANDTKELINYKK